MATLERAIEIAVLAHKGALDKADAPYILHPLRVMMRVDSQTEKIVAVLHLRREGFSEEVLTALDGVTRRADESYEEFVRRSAGNPVSRRVKIADLEDNMDVRRIRELTEKDVARLNRYMSAWRSLTNQP
jgi:(p)ppGpp synthase/HD superfamily hydrolase